MEPEPQKQLSGFTGGIWDGLDNNAITSLYQQLEAGTEHQLSSLGLDTYPQNPVELQSQPSFNNLLVHASSMDFSYPSLNAPRRGTSGFLSRGFSSQSTGLGVPQVPEGEAPMTWSTTQPIEMAMTQQIGMEYEAPPPQQLSVGSQAFHEQVNLEAGLHPSEFNLEGIRMNDLELDNLSKAAVALERLKELEESCPSGLENMRRMQSQAIVSGNSSSVKQLETDQANMADTLEKAIQELFLIVRTVVLSSSILLVARLLSQQFQLHQHVLEMLKRELELVFANGNVIPANAVPPVVSLYVVEQPLPHVVFKEKPIDESYVVAVLTASQQDIVIDKHVTADLNSGDLQVKAGTAMLTNHMVPVEWNVNERKAKFDALSINVSTRMAPTTLKFQTSVSRGAFHSSIMTTPTFPMIVITNESQWFEAAGKLLLLDTFNNARSVPWAQFANTLHSHFLKATRQTGDERPLYHFELHYIHQRFFDKAEHVTEKQGIAFWAWFGQCLQTIRFKRYISTLWNTGVIFGFVTKDHCNKVLQGQGLGTFIIRFSESLPGLFGVAYVSDDPKEKIKHCLIKNEDIGSNKSLAEFLRDKEQFQLLLRMDPQEVGKIRRSPKDIVLQQFYSKKKATSSASNPGYIVL